MSNGWAKVKKASAYAGVSERTFRSWLSKGLRHARLPSGAILVSYSAIDEFLASFEVGGEDLSNLDRIVGEMVEGMAGE